MSALTWTPARDALLKRLRWEGKSYAAVAAIMGTTKNSALARARRAGLEGPMTRRELGAVRHPVSEFPPPGHCQWIVNDRSPFVFCGHAAKGIWCAAHRKRVYIPIRAKAPAP